MRINLLVPLPQFDDFDEFNKTLLTKPSELLKQEHYILKQSIFYLHFKNINELKQLPSTSFVCTQYLVENLTTMVDLQLKTGNIII